MATFPTTPGNPYNLIEVLGPNGNPFQPQAGAEPPRLEHDWTDRNVGTYESILGWAAAMPGYNEDILIQNKGYDEADRMLTFSSFVVPLTLLYDAVLWKCPEVIPAVATQEEDPARFERAQEMAKFCHYLITNIVDPKTGMVTDFREAIRDMLDAVRVGFSVTEKLARWYEDGPYKGKLGLRGFVFKEQKQIGFWLHRKTLKPLAINTFTPLDGYEMNIPMEKFLLYTFQQRKALPYGWGVFRPGHKHVVCWDLLNKLRMIILEKYGGGFMWAHYDNPKQKQMILQAMELMKRGAGIALPRGLDLTLQQMAGNGIESLHKALEDHKGSITELILGQTLTTSQGQKGSYAHAIVHENTQEFKMAKVRKDIEFLVSNQLFRQFILFNFGPSMLDVVPTFSLGVWNLPEITAWANALGVLVDHGIVGARLPWNRKVMGLPPFDPKYESELTMEPGRERITLQEGINAPVQGGKVTPTVAPGTPATTTAPSRPAKTTTNKALHEHGVFVRAGESPPEDIDDL